MRKLILSTAAGLILSALASTPSQAAVLLSENFDELTPVLATTDRGYRPVYAAGFRPLPGALYPRKR
jgi:hypothetical protein